MINIKECIKMIFISLFITYTIYEKFMLPELQIPMLVSIIFMFSIFIINEIKKRTGKFKIYSCIAYAIFAFFMVIGDSFKKYGSFYGIFGNPFKNTNILVELFEEFAPVFSFLNGSMGNVVMLISSICKGVGYYFIIGYFIEWLKYLFSDIDKYKKYFKKYDEITNKIFGEKVFVKVFVILLVAWLPYLVIKFPGSLTMDSIAQIEQMLGERELTTHHPVFSTILIGGCVKFGVLLGSKNLGIFLYTILQYVFSAATFAYCISVVNNYNKKNVYSWILLIFYAFSPAIPSYVTLIVKDTFYSCIFSLFILSLINIIINLKQEKIIKKDVILLSIESFILMISRNNGMYSVVPTLIALVIACLIKMKKEVKVIAILILPMVAYSCYNYLQYDILNIKKGSIREALSIPFQQTARYVKTYPNEVTDYEKEVIDKVLDYDNLAELYIPTLSDPVKATYKEDKEALKEYFKVWFEQLKKHPIIYIESTVNSSYIAFYPDEPNMRTYGIISDLDNSQPDGIFKVLRILLLSFVMGLSLIPMISIFINPVFYIWILIYIVIRCVYKKQVLNLIIFIPMIVQILVIIAGPAVLNNARYIYPIHWSILLTLPFIISNVRSKRGDKKINYLKMI